jgi:hypothetical protein
MNLNDLRDHLSAIITTDSPQSMSRFDIGLDTRVQTAGKPFTVWPKGSNEHNHLAPPKAHEAFRIGQSGWSPPDKLTKFCTFDVDVGENHGGVVVSADRAEQLFRILSAYATLYTSTNATDPNGREGFHGVVELLNPIPSASRTAHHDICKAIMKAIAAEVQDDFIGDLDSTPGLYRAPKPIMKKEKAQTDAKIKQKESIFCRVARDESHQWAFDAIDVLGDNGEDPRSYHIHTGAAIAKLNEALGTDLTTVCPGDNPSERNGYFQCLTDGAIYVRRFSDIAEPSWNSPTDGPYLYLAPGFTTGHIPDLWARAAKDVLKEVDALWDLDGKKLYVFDEGRWKNQSTTSFFKIATVLQAAKQALSKHLGREASTNNKSQLMDSICAQVNVRLGEMSPQFWLTDPPVDSPSWQDPRNILVTPSGLLNPVAYAKGEQAYVEGQKHRLFSQMSLDIDYDPKAKGTPLHDQFLGELKFTKLEQAYFMEQRAISLFPCQWQVVLAWFGQSGAGKGLATDIDKGILGTYFAGDEAAQLITHFGLDGIDGRQLLSIPEVGKMKPEKMAQFVTKLKQLSGGDPFRYAVKHNPSVDMYWPPIPRLSGNEGLEFQDTRGALERRVRPVVFRRVLDKNKFEDGYANRVVRSEGPALLNALLAAYKTAIRRGDFKIPESAQRKIEMITGSNPVALFVNECLVQRDDFGEVEATVSNTIAQADLKKAYTAWAVENGEEQVTCLLDKLKKEMAWDEFKPHGKPRRIRGYNWAKDAKKLLKKK